MKKWHPDKFSGRGAAEVDRAKQMFQQIAEAYEVLSDPDARARYDKFGKQAGATQTFTDPQTLFSCIFGSGKFNDFCGVSALASRIMATAPDGTPPPAERLREIQRQRVAGLVTKLDRMLSVYVGDGEHPPNKQGFVEWARRTAEALASVNFGEALLGVVGYIYTRAAQSAIDASVPVIGWVGLPVEVLRKIGHDVRSQVDATDAAFAIMKDKGQQEQLQQLLAHQGNVEEEIDRMLRSKGSVIDTLWKLQVVDIEQTLREVCSAVLSAPSSGREHSRRRARCAPRLPARRPVSSTCGADAPPVPPPPLPLFSSIRIAGR